MPGPEYFNMPAFNHTPEMHRAHTSPKGTPYPEDLIPGMKSTKMAKVAMKFAHKPHLKMNTPKTKTRARPVKKRKKQ